ncbi:MAG TPA: hypothetical protein VJ673_24505 [Aromatoleum sp.]|uniref:hypothetical protein n=1 Tax=Aromatoleum sp. TaxID=2307007 RepID=UPI002B4827E2|nr:hypothetical protein [Aromatoleum sp.]HJV28860.1 hypothetical protein [Aromatoleum sp.]
MTTDVQSNFEQDFHRAFEQFGECLGHQMLQLRWHSTTVTEDGKGLLILFEDHEERAWGMSLDLARPLDGQPVRLSRVD